jgi:hypothetical protein
MKAKPETKIPVTKRALTQRVNRLLAKSGEMLHVRRYPPATATYIRPLYYIVNLKTKRIVEQLNDVTELEEWAREGGLLAEWEELTK